MRLRCLLLLGTFVCAVSAQDPLNNAGFQHFYSLEYDEALADFTAQAAKEPSDPRPFNHVAQTILFRQMFRSGSLESDLIRADSFLSRPKLNLSAADQTQFSGAITAAAGTGRSLR